MQQSTIEGLLATFQAIVNMTEDEAIIAACETAIARAEADKTYTAEIPEPLLAAVYIYMASAHTLATIASERPKALRGMKPEELFELVSGTTRVKLLEAPEAEQHEILIQAAGVLAKVSGAVSFSHREEDL